MKLPALLVLPVLFALTLVGAPLAQAQNMDPANDPLFCQFVSQVAADGLRRRYEGADLALTIQEFRAAYQSTPWLLEFFVAEIMTAWEVPEAATPEEQAQQIADFAYMKLEACLQMVQGAPTEPR